MGILWKISGNYESDIIVLTCSFCFLNNDINGDREFIYIVFYPDFVGYVCHECNKRLSKEHSDKIVNDKIEEKEDNGVKEISDCF